MTSKSYTKIDLDFTALTSDIEDLRASEDTEEGTLEHYFPDENVQVDNVLDYEQNIFTTDVQTELGQSSNSTAPTVTPAAGEVNRLTVPDQLKDEFFDLVNSLKKKQKDYLIVYFSVNNEVDWSFDSQLE